MLLNEQVIPCLLVVCALTVTGLSNRGCNWKDWQCANGLCIYLIGRCDNFQDCFDGSDETSCQILDICSGGRRLCDSGECIHKDYFCDGVRDCADGSDERCFDWTHMFNTTKHMKPLTTVPIVTKTQTTSTNPYIPATTTYSTGKTRPTTRPTISTPNAKPTYSSYRTTPSPTTTVTTTNTAQTIPTYSTSTTGQTYSTHNSRTTFSSAPSPTTTVTTTNTAKTIPTYSTSTTGQTYSTHNSRTTFSSAPSPTTTASITQISTVTIPNQTTTRDIVTATLKPPSPTTSAGQTQTTVAVRTSSSRSPPWWTDIPDETTPVTITTTSVPCIDLENFTVGVCRRNFRGYFPHQYDCQKFIVCEWGVQYMCTCPNRTLWEQKHLTCVWASDATCIQGPNTSQQTTTATTISTSTSPATYATLPSPNTTVATLATPSTTEQLQTTTVATTTFVVPPDILPQRFPPDSIARMTIDVKTHRTATITPLATQPTSTFKLPTQMILRAAPRPFFLKTSGGQPIRNEITTATPYSSLLARFFRVEPFSVASHR